MREHVLRFIGTVFLTILALLGIGAALHIVVTLPLEGKGPEWIGAIGTVATLIGTIWLATESERKRRRTELDLALVSAARFLLWTVALQSALRSAIRVLPRSLNAQDPRPTYAVCAGTLEGAGLWTTADLAPLVPLPNHAAARLAMLQTHIAWATSSLKAASESATLDLLRIDEFCKVLSTNMQQSAETLDIPNKICLEFLGEHGFSNEALA
jgi:hypothetical protein